MRRNFRIRARLYCFSGAQIQGILVYQPGTRIYFHGAVGIYASPSTDDDRSEL